MEISIKEFKGLSKTTMAIENVVLPIDYKKIGNVEYHFYKKPEIKGKLSKDKSRIIGEFEINVFLEEQCSRCLKELQNSYEFQVDGVLVDENLEYDDFESIIIEDEKVNLTQILEIALIENTSIKTLCDEGCKGLCKTCGGNLNLDECICDSEEYDVDPRLEKLKDILKWLF